MADASALKKKKLKPVNEYSEKTVLNTPKTALSMQRKRKFCFGNAKFCTVFTM